MLNVRIVGICATLLLTLSACYPQTATPASAELLQAPAGSLCETCEQATLAYALTLEKNYAENQAAATAEAVRADAQATLNSANATLSAIQTQDQNNANAVAAQIAATAEIVRANAQATIYSAGATQNAALTQDAIRQTQMADLATTDAQVLLLQQNMDLRAASTQTAIADQIATQTQAAAATSQWYTDQTRQRAEDRQGPITFLWMWCLPIFILLLAALVLWGFWRWLRIQQANQRILVSPVEQLPPVAEVIPHHHHDNSSPTVESDVIDVDGGYRLTNPDDQVPRWMDEVKRKLQGRDEEDEDDSDD
jgi:hypothetical protein